MRQTEPMSGSFQEGKSRASIGGKFPERDKGVDPDLGWNHLSAAAERSSNYVIRTSTFFPASTAQD